MSTGCGGSCTDSLDPGLFSVALHTLAQEKEHAGTRSCSCRTESLHSWARRSSEEGNRVRRNGAAGAATDPGTESVPPVRRMAGILPGNGDIYPLQRRARRSSDGKRSAAGALHPKAQRGQEKTPASSGQMPFEPSRWTGRPQVLSDRQAREPQWRSGRGMQTEMCCFRGTIWVRRRYSAKAQTFLRSLWPANLAQCRWSVANRRASCSSHLMAWPYILASSSRTLA